MKLTIGYLYPQQMNIYGDEGNIICLRKRAQWRGIEVKINEYDLKSKIKPGENDFYFFGGGQDQEQVLASQDLQSKKEVLTTDFSQGSVFLSICGGYQLLGHYYQDQNGEKLPGIGLIDAYTKASPKRMIGNLVIEVNPGLNLQPKTLVGFENHSGQTFLGSGVEPLGKVVKGFGNKHSFSLRKQSLRTGVLNGEDRYEGAWSKTFFGCYLHGSLLPKNPHFADYLLGLAIRKNNPDYNLVPLDDSLELKTHQKAIKLFG